MPKSALPAPWGTLALNSGERRHWRIGPLGLWVQQTANEVRIDAHSDGPALDERSAWALIDDAVPDAAIRTRCALRADRAQLTMLPALADRSVVVRTEEPMTILSGDEALFFVGTQMWVRLLAGEGHQPLIDVPTFRLSDTWFGSPTGPGELCYASRTSARTSLADVPIRPARVIAPLRVRNRGSDPLLIERLKVPVGHLTIYVDARGRYWTNELGVDREEDGIVADVHVAAGPPPLAGPVQHVADPRVAVGTLRRALNALVG